MSIVTVDCGRAASPNREYPNREHSPYEIHAAISPLGGAGAGRLCYALHDFNALSPLCWVLHVRALCESPWRQVTVKAQHCI